MIHAQLKKHEIQNSKSIIILNQFNQVNQRFRQFYDLTEHFLTYDKIKSIQTFKTSTQIKSKRLTNSIQFGNKMKRTYLTHPFCIAINLINNRNNFTLCIFFEDTKNTLIVSVCKRCIHQHRFINRTIFCKIRNDGI
jgi:hypothetical protein